SCSLLRARAPPSTLFPYTTLFRSGTTYTLTGLDAETNYQYYVRQDCDNGDLSVWAGPFSFYTGYCTVTSSSTTSTSYKIIGFSTDRKSTRLNSSHVKISYAVFCLK